MSDDNDDAIPVEMEASASDHGVSSAEETGGFEDYFKHGHITSDHHVAEVAKHVGKGGVKARASIFMKSPSASPNISPVAVKGPQRRTSKFAMQVAGATVGEKCLSCSKTVYAAERMTSTLGSFHKNCFRCGLTTGKGCGNGLNASTYDVYGGVLYCKTCSKKQHHGDKQQKAYTSTDGPMSPTGAAGSAPATPGGPATSEDASTPTSQRRKSWRELNEGRSSFGGSPDGSAPGAAKEAEVPASPVASVMSVFGAVTLEEGEEGEEEEEGETDAPTADATIADAATADATTAEEEAQAAPASTPEPKAAAAIAEGEDEDEGEDAFDAEPAAMVPAPAPAGDSPAAAQRRPSFNPLPGQKSLHECPFTFPFDKNGAIYWVGTMGNQVDYENPQKTGSLYLEISTLYRGQLLNLTSYTHAETAADRIAAATYTNNTSRSWLVVDFGPERSLRPSYYCLKHGASGIGNAIRNWTLEGKVDEDSPWVELRRHTNDTTMREEPQSVAGYELSAESCRSNFFRIFRITQSGKNSGGNDCLFIAGIDFYGIMKVTTMA